MRITNVSLDGDLDRFGGRALVVKTDRGTFNTPHRVLTSQEFQYKANLPFEPPLNNKISEVVAQFSRANWDKFMTTNGSFNSRLGTIEFFSDKMAYTLKRFYPQIPSDVVLDDTAIKQLLELQRMSDLDFITIPNLSSEIRDFEKIVTSFRGGSSFGETRTTDIFGYGVGTSGLSGEIHDSVESLRCRYGSDPYGWTYISTHTRKRPELSVAVGEPRVQCFSSDVVHTTGVHDCCGIHHAFTAEVGHRLLQHSCRKLCLSKK